MEGKTYDEVIKYMEEHENDRATNPFKKYES